jgi:hypothetical protein
MELRVTEEPAADAARTTARERHAPAVDVARRAAAPVAPGLGTRARCVPRRRGRSGPCRPAAGLGDWAIDWAADWAGGDVRDRAAGEPPGALGAWLPQADDRPLDAHRGDRQCLRPVGSLSSVAPHRGVGVDEVPAAEARERGADVSADSCRRPTRAPAAGVSADLCRRPTRAPAAGSETRTRAATTVHAPTPAEQKTRWQICAAEARRLLSSRAARGPPGVDQSLSVLTTR